MATYRNGDPILEDQPATEIQFTLRAPHGAKISSITETELVSDLKDFVGEIPVELDWQIVVRGGPVILHNEMNPEAD